MEKNVETNVKGTPGRKGVTAEQVFGAADAIRAKGTEPTNTEIQKMLGGSFSTISPMLRQWRGGKGAVTPSSQISEMMVKALSAYAQPHVIYLGHHPVVQFQLLSQHIKACTNVAIPG